MTARARAVGGPAVSAAEEPDEAVADGEEEDEGGAHDGLALQLR